MTLDTPTLFSAITVAYATGAVLMFALAFIPRDLPTHLIRSWVLWGTALTLSATATFLVGQRGSLSPLLSLHLSNILVMVGYGLRPNSLSLLTKKRFAYPLLPIVPVLGWLVLAQFSWFQHSVATRVVYIQAFCLISSIICLTEAWSLRHKMPVTFRTLAFGFILDAVTRLTFVTSQLVLQADTFLSTFKSESLKICLILLLLTIVMKAIGLGFAMFEYLQWDFTGQTEKDALTGLENDRPFLPRLQTAIDRAGRTDTSSRSPQTALATLRIESLKTHEARYGKAMTDALLRLVATSCQQAFPNSVTTARLDDNLFAILLPGETLLSAEKQIDKLKLMLRVESQLASLERAEVKLQSALTLVLQTDTPESILKRLTEAMATAVQSDEKSAPRTPQKAPKPAPEPANEIVLLDSFLCTDT